MRPLKWWCICAAVVGGAVLFAEPARAERFGTPRDYPMIVMLPDYLANPYKPGEKVSVFGYPVCEAPNKCTLFAFADGTVPSVGFDASALLPPDRARLMHCANPALTQPCVAAVYGLVARGSKIAVKDIWWR